VWARTDRLVVRRFVTETELPTHIVLDLSGDLGTGARTGAHRTARGRADLDSGKAGLAITLAATLAYFLYLHGEPVGLEIVAGDAPWTSLAPRTGRAHLQRILLALAAAKPGGVAGLGAALSRVGGRTRRRSWVAVIGDGMEEPARWLPALGAFLRRRAEVSFVHVYDPGEWKLSFSRPVLFYSPEGGEDLAVDPAGARRAFADVAREYVAEVRAGVRKWGGTYLLVPTDRPLEDVLRRLVKCEPGVATGPDLESGWV
jgi:uncharacterized protein (DUF58 family)